MSIMIQQASEECLLVHLSNIIVLHYIYFLTPNYRSLITRLSIIILLRLIVRNRVTTDVYM